MTAGAKKKESFCAVNHYAWNVISDRLGPDVHVGGEEVQHALLTRQLARAGHRVVSLVGDFGQSKETISNGVKVISTYRENEGLPGLRFIYPKIFRIWRAMLKADADVYYTSCAGPWVGVISIFAKLKKRRFVFRVASDSDCDPSKLLVSNFRDRLLYTYGLKRASTVLVQTENQRQILLTNFGVPSVVAKMLVAGPDLPKDQNQRPIDVLWLANLRPLKRPLYFAELAQRIPELQFSMAGGPYVGAQALFDEAAKRAEQLDNLAFHGQVQFSKTEELFSNSKIFVNTSELEGFPNTFLQAWSNGIPVVTTFDPDGLVEKLRLGIVCKSVDELESGVRLLLTSEEIWKEYSTRCIQYMRDNYDAANISASYFGLNGGSS